MLCGRKKTFRDADSIERHTGNDKDIWETLQHKSLLGSYNECQEFLQGKKESNFVRFKNLKEVPKPVTKEAWMRIIRKEYCHKGVCT
jgi:predicted transcriptional regulator